VAARLTRALVLMALTGALVSSATGTSSRVVVITVKSVQTDAVVVVDAPPKGINAGKFSARDVVVERDNLFNRVRQLGRGAGAKVGTDQVRVTFVNSRTANAVGSATFPGGTVRFKGRISAEGSTSSLTVTGGTGKYAGARGSVTEPASDSDPKNATNTYHLLLP
jgi:hypothetical protein